MTDYSEIVQGYGLSQHVAAAPDPSDQSGEYPITTTVDAVQQNKHTNFGPAWAERMFLITVSVLIFTFLISLKLDMDLPGSLWNCFVPLFVCQGIFTIFALAYGLAIKFSWNGRWKLNVPPEATIWQFSVEVLVICGLFAFECTLIPKIQDVVSYSWTAVFSSLYIVLFLMAMYYGAVYVGVPMVVRAEHFREHSLSRNHAAGRGLVTALVFIFAMLMNLYLEDQYPPPLWTAFIPLYVGFVVVAYWSYKYFSVGEVREITVFELAVAAISVIFVIIGSVFFFLKEAGHLSTWSWFATLSPIMFLELILMVLLFTGISMVKKVMHKRDMSEEKDDDGNDMLEDL